VTLPNRKNERFFLSKIRQGVLILDRKGNIFNTITNRFIGSIGTSKYKAIGMKDSKGKVRHILVHRLMWLHFKGPIPDGLEVNHRDGVKSNLKLSNFELTTNSENVIHAYENRLIDKNKISKSMLGLRAGEKNPTAKLTNKQANSIRKLYRTGKYTHRNLADIYNIDRSCITGIISNKHYKAVS